MVGGWGPGDVTKEAGVEAEEASLEAHQEWRRMIVKAKGKRLVVT